KDKSLLDKRWKVFDSIFKKAKSDTLKHRFLPNLQRRSGRSPLLTYPPCQQKQFYCTTSSGDYSAFTRMVMYPQNQHG
ncbi:MAG: hypothetical protein RR696_15365, partial [Clostridia bacterium]